MALGYDYEQHLKSVSGTKKVPYAWTNCNKSSRRAALLVMRLSRETI